jgi:hypothetical protein
VVKVAGFLHAALVIGAGVINRYVVLNSGAGGIHRIVGKAVAAIYSCFFAPAIAIVKADAARGSNTVAALALPPGAASRTATSSRRAAEAEQVGIGII